MEGLIEFIGDIVVGVIELIPDIFPSKKDKKWKR